MEMQEEKLEIYRLIAKIVIQLDAPLFKNDNIYYFNCFLLIYQKNLGMYEFCKQVISQKFPWDYVKQIHRRFYESNQHHPTISYSELMEIFPCEIVNDVEDLKRICSEVIVQNQKIVIDYKNGKTNALNALKGQVMKLTRGKANITLVQDLLIELINI